MAKAGLGRGLDVILPSPQLERQADQTKDERAAELEIDISLLKPNPYQPRKEFDEESLRELADSIREHGIIQPVIAEEADEGGYYIIAGERRTRAAKLAGLARVPVIVRKYSDERKLEIALIENIQRADLNPVEEAKAYRQLMEVGNLSQEEAAARLGKNRSTVANALRILKLPDDMLASLSSGRITQGHARAILSVVNPADQRVLFEKITNDGLSVREAEKSAAALNLGARAARQKKPEKEPKRESDICSVEQQFIDALGTKVVVKGTLERGSVAIDYFSRADLDRIYELIVKPRN